SFHPRPGNAEGNFSEFDGECWTFSVRSLMPGTGLEPARLSAPDPKSGASANSATLANNFWILDFRLPIGKRPAFTLAPALALTARSAATVTALRSPSLLESRAGS